VYYAAFLLPIAGSVRVFWLTVTRSASTLRVWLAAGTATSCRDVSSAVPQLCAVLILTRLAAAPRETWLVGAIAVVVLGAASARMPILSDSRFLDTGVSRARFDKQGSVKIKPTD
jgi:hypothetical protein